MPTEEYRFRLVEVVENETWAGRLGEAKLFNAE
jgi:hypothetical protein